MPVVLVVVIRSTISFFILLLFVRLMGKQQVAQLTFFDYIVGITIGSIASTLSVQINESLLSTLAGMATWTLLAIAVAFLSMHSSLILTLVNGRSTIVVKNGKIQEANLKRIRISLEELMSELRTKGIFNMADVEFAIFESGGKFSVQQKQDKKPLTRADMNIDSTYEGLPITLILDGAIMEKELKELRLSKAWLYHQLEKQSINDASEVSLAQLDTQGNMYVDLKGNKPFYIISTKN